MTRIWILPALMLLLFSCETEINKSIDVSGIDVNVEIERFDKKFYQSGSGNLAALKLEYPYLFPEQNHDSVWVQKMTNPEELELFNRANKEFEDFSDVKAQLTSLFKHIKYDYKAFKSPKVITLITNLDYENKMFYADSLLFVSLDMYLGADSEVYADFPKYLAYNYKKSHLIVDVAKAVIKNSMLRKQHERMFLKNMINEGKRMYLLDRYLPELSDLEIIGYRPEQLDWAVANEIDVWKYFVSQQLLYSTDPNLNLRFINEAPFSKFYNQSDKDSPGRIGVYMGWQIVRSFMKNNDVTLQQLLVMDGEELFKKSKYKPKK